MSMTHPYLRHPLTGAPIVALGVTRAGRLIWPVLGGAQPAGESAPAGGEGAPAATGATAAATTAGATPASVAPAATGAAAEPPAQPGQQPFKAGAPWRELPLEDQVEYWRTQSRRHEARHLAELGLKPGELDTLRSAAAERDRLADAGRTDAERAVAEAKTAGRLEALAEVGGKLVDAHMRVAIGARMSAEQVTGLLSNLDLRRFQTDTGDVDAAKVTDFVATILPAAAPAASAQPDAGQASTAATAATAGATTGQPGTGAPARQVPDMGQGDRQTARPSGLAAGREIAAQRFGAKARSAGLQQ